jgi:hypothetical protein
MFNNLKPRGNNMNKLLTCRRTFIALVGIVALTWLGYKGMDVALAITGIAGTLAAANSYEKKVK